MAYWIKLQTNMFGDRKMQLLQTLPQGDSYITFWIRLLCLAGEINDSGLIYVAKNIAYTPQTLAKLTGKSANLVRKMLQRLQELEMIEIDENGIIFIVDWSISQNIEELDRIKNQTKERVRRFRANKKAANNDNVTEDVTLHVTQSNVTVTGQNKNKNKNKNIDIEAVVAEREKEKEALTAAAAASEVRNFWFNNTGRDNEVIRADIADLVQQYGSDVTKTAMAEAIRCNVYKIPYVKSIAERIASGEEWTRKKPEAFPF